MKYPLLKKVVPIAMTYVKNRKLQDYIESWNSEIKNRIVENPEDSSWKIKNSMNKILLSKQNYEKYPFKKNVKHVYIEPFSYCNRKCYFCPNADLKRIDTKNTHLDRKIISEIFDSLESIDYDGAISFHEYNEPLADKIIFSILEETAKKLPNAEIKLTSNGDYLNEKVLKILTECNVSFIKISLYGPDHGHFDKGEMEKTLKKLSKRTNCDIKDLTIDSEGVRRNLSARLEHEKILMHVYGCDYGDTGFDRGGIVPFSANLEKENRIRPCFAPTAEFHVDYLGNVKPCCNLTPDRDHHKDYIMSNMYDGKDIFSHYNSLKFRSFREDTFRESPLPDACKTCTWPWT